MQRLEYRTVDKAAWGDGPWQSEPDKIQWQDEATGYPCLIVRHPHFGFFCGYVGVQPNHPSYGKDYNDVGVSAHGGLTFADSCGHGEDESRGVCHRPAPGEPDNVWWLGFDCGHYMDFAPALDSMRRPKSVYRDVAYVTSQCESLAKQLKDLA